MIELTFFNGDCPPSEDVELVNCFTYLAHYRHAPELKDELMGIFNHTYEDNALWLSDYKRLIELFPEVKRDFEEMGGETLTDEEWNSIIPDENGERDIHQILKTKENKDSRSHFFGYKNLLDIFGGVEYHRVSNPKECYQSNFMSGLTMRSHEKYYQFLRALAQYQTMRPRRAFEYIIFIPDDAAPVQLLEVGIPGQDPYCEKFPKGIKVNPSDYLVHNWEYNCYTPDFSAILDLIVAREHGDPYIANPDTKTYAIEISRETYEYAKKRLEEIKASDTDPNDTSIVSDAERNLLSDVVEAYYRDHEKYEEERPRSYAVGPSTVAEVPEYWLSVKLNHLLKDEIKAIDKEVEALGLAEEEADKLKDAKKTKLIEDYIRAHSTIDKNGNFVMEDEI